MLTTPRLAAPVTRSLAAASSTAAGAEQAILCPGAYCPAEGAEQAWTPWVMPAEGVDD